MGLATAQGITETDLTLEQQLHWHLRGNHFPPIPTSMIQPCIDAIDAYFDEDTDQLITLPEGVAYRGSDKAPAWAIIEQHHLHAWCIDPEEYTYED
jgi:hypothetical protein